MKNLLLFIFMLMLSAGYGQYCTTGLYSDGCTFGDDIDDFSFGSYSQTATGCASGVTGYSDYTSDTISVTQGLPYPVHATANYTDQSIKLWIDFNDDQDFDDSGEEILNSGSVTFGDTQGPFDDTITLSQSTSSGIHRMRVRVVYLDTAFTSCSAESYGEVHDYTVNVVPNTAGNCPSFSNFQIDSITGNGAKINWASGTGNSSFFMEYGVAGFTPGTGTTISGSYPGSQPPVVLSGLSPQSSYDVYLCEVCNSGADTVCFASPVSFSTPNLCPEPSNVTVLSTTQQSVTVGLNSVFTSFDVEWGPAGFTQGTGCLATFNTTTGDFTIDNSSDPSCAVQLASQGAYEFYIRSNCTGAGNGYSTWLGPFTFVTTCPMVNLPYSEDFDNDLGCFSVTDGGSGTDTWIQAPAGGNGNYTDDLDGTGHASVDSDGAGSGPTLEETLTSPYIDATNLSGTLVLEFDQYYRHLSSSATVEVWDGNQWDTVLIQNSANVGSFASPDHQTIDITAYANDSLQVRFHYDDGGSWAWYWIIDNFSVQDVLCTSPTVGTLGVGSLSATSANVFWGAGGAGDETYITWGTPGFTPGSSAMGIDSVPGIDTSYTISGLSPQTTYDFYIQDSCAGSGLSGYVGPFTFTTACLPLTAPFYEGFEASSSSRNCWKNHYISGFNAWIFAQGSSGGAISSAYSGSENARFTSTSAGGITRLVSPMIDISSLTVPFLSFYYAQEVWFSDQNELTVYVKDHNSSSWTQVFHNADDVASWTLVEAVLQVNSDTIQLAFEGVDNYGRANVLDEVSVDEAPPCPDPSGLNISGIIDTAAMVNWTPSASATSSQVWFGPQGFYQGSQTPGGTKTWTTNSSLTLDTLGSNQCYEVLVRTACAPNDTSQWIGPVVFCTSCSPVSAPYFQNFETFATGHFEGAENCWNFVSNNPGTTPSGGFSWEARNAPQTTSTNTGPAGDNSFYPATGGTWMHSDNSGGLSDDSTMLISPLVDISALSTPQVEYHFHNYALTTSNYRQPLYVDVFDGSTWHNKVHDIDTVFQGADTDPWKDTIIDLAPYSTTGLVQIRFRTKITRSSGGSGDVSIDDVYIGDPVTCFKPRSPVVSNISASTADLGWAANAQSTGNDFQISYGSNLSDPDSGTTTMVTGTTFSLTGLTSATDYCFYVREACAPGDTSLWLGPVCFSTACISQALPYYESFDTWEPACWEVDLATVDWISYAGTSGDNWAEADFWGNSAGAMVMNSPPLDITDDAMLRYVWSHLANTTYPDDEMIVRATVVGSGTWDTLITRKTLNGDFDDPSAGNTAPGSGIEDTLLLDPLTYTGNQVIIQFVANTGWGPSLFVNDVYVEELPACPSPTGLSSSSIGCDSAVISWNSLTGSSVLVYGPTGMSPATGTYTGVVSSPHTITGLAAGTGYDLYVADTCAGDTGQVGGPHNFTTAGAGVVAAFSVTPGTPSMTNRTMYFDASASQGATTYHWDFGDGNSGTAVSTSNIYSANGSYQVKLIATSNCGVDSLEQTVLVEEINLQENVLGSSLKLYPNPSNDRVNISFIAAGPQAHIGIFDLSGKQVMSFELSERKGAYEDSFEISALADGVYMLRVSDGENRAVQRLIKK